jgi:predicted alpha/beta superfamily hydrolase
MYRRALSLLALLPLFAPDSSPAQGVPPRPELVNLHIRLHVPESTPTVYITGEAPEFGPWDPAKVPMAGTGAERTCTIRHQKGEYIQYKFTLGSWDKELLDEDGFVLDNFASVADAERTIDITGLAFGSGKPRPLPPVEGPMTVTGQTRLFKAVPSKFLAPTRDVIVWLPPGYDASPETRYPVLYMQDGQNIFDPKTSATGVDWGVDELLTEKIGAGQLPPMIVVGVYCTADRRPEYDPFGKGEQYAQFLINELKPMIDREFRTLDGPENTSVMGSSMGGLISLYLGWKHPEVFGRVAALSCHFHWNNAEFLNHLEATGSYPKSVKLYVDYGTRGVDVEYEPYAKRFEALLHADGWKSGEGCTVYRATHHNHSEICWRARLGTPMGFLFGK